MTGIAITVAIIYAGVGTTLGISAFVANMRNIKRSPLILIAQASENKSDGKLLAQLVGYSTVVSTVLGIAWPVSLVVLAYKFLDPNSNLDAFVVPYSYLKDKVPAQTEEPIESRATITRVTGGQLKMRG